MVIPTHIPRVLAVSCSQVFIEFIVAVAGSVIFDRNDLEIGQMESNAIAIGAATVFINVIANLENGIQIISCGDVAISVEIAAFIIRA